MIDRSKISELDPKVQYAAHRWLDSCEAAGYSLRVLECYRPQERQNKLYAQGRTEPGPIVTYTLKSYHTLRLALDFLPMIGTYEKIGFLATHQGITHPFPWDKPHVEFTNVPPEQTIFTPSIDARISALQRALARSSGAVSLMIARQLERLLKRKSS